MLSWESARGIIKSFSICLSLGNGKKIRLRHRQEVRIGTLRQRLFIILRGKIEVKGDRKEENKLGRGQRKAGGNPHAKTRRRRSHGACVSTVHPTLLSPGSRILLVHWGKLLRPDRPRKSEEIARMKEQHPGILLRKDCKERGPPGIRDCRGLACSNGERGGIVSGDDQSLYATVASYWRGTNSSTGIRQKKGGPC